MTDQEQIAHNKKLIVKELLSLYGHEIVHTEKYKQFLFWDNIHPLRVFIDEELEIIDPIEDNDTYYHLNIIDNLILNLIELTDNESD